MGVRGRGKHEREARKRHRRGRTCYISGGTSTGWLKLGRKHSLRDLRKFLMADTEKQGQLRPNETSGKLAATTLVSPILGQ